MTGRVFFILKSSNDVQRYPNFEFIISFKIFCSSSVLPVAKKNLHFFALTIFSMNLINIFAGILFVGPDPPIPISIFKSSVFILNFFFANSASTLLILIFGLLKFLIFKVFSKNNFAVAVICCLFLLKSGY